MSLNVIYAGSVDADPERWRDTQTMIEAEIAKSGYEGGRESEKSLDFLIPSKDAFRIYECCPQNRARLFNFACFNAFQLWRLHQVAMGKATKC